MNRQELSAMLQTETESIAQIIKSDFMKTDTSSLLHVVSGEFNLMWLLLDIALRNNTYIGKIKNAILVSAELEQPLEYQPDFIERIFLDHFAFAGYHVHSASGINHSSFEAVCNEMISQQHFIRELDIRSYSVDITKRKIACCLYGLVKISIPGILYWLIMQQKIQFMSARHILASHSY